MNRKTGRLFIVATPIGNLSDLGMRAREVLASVDLVLAEDTRQTAKILRHYGIAVPTRSCHDHNERQVAAGIIRQLTLGQDIALVSDAGTPLVSDPGYILVRKVREAGIDVSPIPGPSALMAAVSSSGMPVHRFCFEGFLPSRAAQRRQVLSRLSGEHRTMIFFESGHRIAGSLKDMADCFGSEREAALCREMTKIHETFLAGGLGRIHSLVEEDGNQRRGEFVVLVGGCTEDDDCWYRACTLAGRLVPELPVKTASRVAAETFGVSRNRLYRYITRQPPGSAGKA